MFDIAAICLVATALLAYVNHRTVRLPTTIGVMVIALGVSLAVIALDALGLDHGLHEDAQAFVGAIDFSDVLMQGMLSFLLFAGALHVDVLRLQAHRWQVGGLALVGTIASTVVIGGGMYLLLPWVGVPLPWLQCLLFGALISPTDPVAVMGIVRKAGVPKNLEAVIAGESLFNDGVGVVAFALLLGMLGSGGLPTFGHGMTLLLREAGGGLLFGLLLGLVLHLMLRSLDQYEVEVLLTLAAVMGGYALASHLHVSGPLAMVVCGLFVGDRGRAVMSPTTRRYIDVFWELVDDILNSVLFVLIGMEVLLIHFSTRLLLAGAAATAVTLLARWLTVGLPVRVGGRRFGLPTGSATVLTWGGLRGGISVALALSLPHGGARNTVLALTYCVVVFSILAQGLTIGAVVRRSMARGAKGEDQSSAVPVTTRR